MDLGNIEGNFYEIKVLENVLNLKCLESIERKMLCRFAGASFCKLLKLENLLNEISRNM